VPRSTLAVAALLTALSASAAEPPLALVGVNVVPMDRERVVAGQTVLVKDGRIARVGPVKEVPVPEGATRVDAAGKYLMPGLAEMHAHLPGGQAPEALVERVLALFAINGVTTIRGMLGHPRHLPLRARLEKGELLGPRLVTSGPSLNGNSVKSPEEGVRAVAEQKAAGYDFLKIHPGLSLASFDAIAAEAGRQGIRFAGHVPTEVGVLRALEARYATIDHADGYLEAMLKEGAPVDAKQPTFFGLGLVEHLDEGKLQALVRKTVAAGVWVVPTQHLMELFTGPETGEELAKRPEVATVPAPIVENWKKQRTAFLSDPELNPERARRFLAVRRRLLRALHDGGAGLLLGSDAIQVFSVPGFSIPEELASLVRCGLTPYQAYVTGTRNVARFLGEEKDAGTVEEGKRADLLLLDRNPLQDVGNVKSPAGVVLRGRWLPRTELERRLAELKRSAAEPPPPPPTAPPA